METFVIVLLSVLVLFVLIIIIRSVRLVRQAEVQVVERLGRYSRTLGPGLHVLIPFIDRVRQVTDLREQVWDYPPQSVITKDNVPTQLDTVIYFFITDPVKAVYEIQNLPEAILKLSMTAIRNMVGNMELDQLLASREQVNQRLRVIVDEATDPWGVKVNRIELKTIAPPAEIVEAMTKQMKAERDKRASILEAEGIKQSQILKSEGERQSKILQAEGEAKAWETVWIAKSAALKMYLEAIKAGATDDKVLAIKYLETLGEMAKGDSNKVFIPYEATGFLSSLGSIKELFKDKK